MTDRNLRESTKKLRSFYAHLARGRRSLSRPKSRSGMEGGQNAAGADPPNGGQVIPAGGDAGNGAHPGPAGQQDPPNGDGLSPARSMASIEADDDKDYGARIKALEELLVTRSTGTNSRRTSRSASRSSKARSTKVHSPGRSSQTNRNSRSRGNDARADRSPPRRRRSRTRSSRRGYTPSSDRSRSGRRRSSGGRRRKSSLSRSPARRRKSRSPSRRPRTRSSSGRRSRSRSGHRGYDRSRSRPARAESPRSLRKNPDSQREAARELEKQYPSIGPKSSGRRLPKSRATLEPYKNLPPDIKTRAGERRSRKELSLPEHMCGLLFMIKKSMEPGTELHAAVEHVAQVAQDAVSIQWPAVRAWSQSCLSHIEGGSSWLSESMFERERFRLSWSKGRHLSELLIPYPAYNKNDCGEREKHTADGRTWLHICAVCYYGMGDRNTNHGAHNCRKKPGLKLVTDEGRFDYKRRNNQQQRRDDKRDGNKPKN